MTARYRVQTNGLKNRAFISTDGLELEVNVPKSSYEERLAVADRIAAALNQQEAAKGLAAALLALGEGSRCYCGSSKGHRPLCLQARKALTDWEKAHD